MPLGGAVVKEAGKILTRIQNDAATAESASSSDGSHADHVPAPKAPGLFYDPFAARRAVDKRLLQESLAAVVWDVGSVCRVQASFRNSLSVPLFISSAKLLVEGAEHVAFPAPVTLPPRASLPFVAGFGVSKANDVEKSNANDSSCAGVVCVELCVKPLAPGNLVIRGLEVRMGNAVCVIEVDATGRAIEAKCVSAIIFLFHVLYFLCYE
jgi:hypothetical protein